MTPVAPSRIGAIQPRPSAIKHDKSPLSSPVKTRSVEVAVAAATGRTTGTAAGRSPTSVDGRQPPCMWSTWSGTNDPPYKRPRRGAVTRPSCMCCTSQQQDIEHVSPQAERSHSTARRGPRDRCTPSMVTGAVMFARCDRYLVWLTRLAVEHAEHPSPVAVTSSPRLAFPRRRRAGWLVRSQSCRQRTRQVAASRAMVSRLS
jgi:hypothetical protein